MLIIMDVLSNVYPALSQLLLPSAPQPLGLEDCSMDQSLGKNTSAAGVTQRSYLYHQRNIKHMMAYSGVKIQL